MNQVQTLFDLGPRFGGVTYEPAKDEVRLTKSLQKVKDILSEGRWITLDELARRAGCLQTSASARIRDLKKESFGSHKIEKKRSEVSDGLWLYRLTND